MTVEAAIKLKGDDAELKEALRGSETAIKSWAGSVASTFAGLGLVELTHKIMEMGHEWIEAGEKAERSQKRLEAILRSTGNTTGWTAGQLKQMQKEIANLSTYTAGAGREAQIALLKFKSIKGDIFHDALKSSADLAAFWDVSLPEAASALGRALADPEMGLRRLKDAGIVVSDAQRELIQKLMNTGETAKAQKIVLTELSRAVGGQAAAMLDTFGGRWQQFMNRWHAVSVTIGKAIIPILELVIPPLDLIGSTLNKIVPMIGGFTSSVIESAKGLAEEFLPSVETLNSWVGYITETIVSWKRVLIDIGAVIGGTIGVLAALQGSFAAFGAISAAITTAIGAVGTVLGILASPVVLITGLLVAGVYAWSEWTEAGQAAGGIMGVLRGAFNITAEAIKWLTNAVIDFAKIVYDYWKPSIVAAADAIKQWSQYVWSYVSPALQFLLETGLRSFSYFESAIENWRDRAKLAFVVFELAAVRAFGTLRYWLLTAIPEYLRWFYRNWVNILEDIGSAQITILKNVGKNFQDFWEGIKSLFRGEGFKFEFTPLLEGFESVIEELPRIAERVKSSAETALEKEAVSLIGDAISKSEEKFRKNKEIIDGFFKRRERDAEESEEKREEKEKDLSEGASHTSDENMGGGTKGQGHAQVEDLIALNKRITAAAGSTKEKDVATTIEKTSERLEEATSDVAKAVREGNSKTDTLIERIEKMKPGNEYATLA